MIGSLCDVMCLLHIILFFGIGVLVFIVTKKAYIGFSICILIAVAWEIIERFVFSEYFEIYFFTESYVASIYDIFAYNLVGIAFAYFYTRAIITKSVKFKIHY